MAPCRKRAEQTTQLSTRIPLCLPQSLPPPRSRHCRTCPHRNLLGRQPPQTNSVLNLPTHSLPHPARRLEGWRDRMAHERRNRAEQTNQLSTAPPALTRAYAPRALPRVRRTRLLPATLTKTRAQQLRPSAPRLPWKWTCPHKSNNCNSYSKNLDIHPPPACATSVRSQQRTRQHPPH